jgi:hypothetical protein
VGDHTLLASEKKDENTFQDFLWVRSAHEFERFKESLRNTIVERGSFTFNSAKSKQPNIFAMFAAQ